ncbi:hypothetical protein [Aidingimonas halophila]|uniref:DUF3311 domain-containing protein n=1 Tax=Aidingimonas halophila TaxID=574349 RepID=A0A1H3H908_9GAMM|nr:hypothetical protein [Aidingimonas halophila]GHC36485.1 hypothetical protein GCM10008094_32140 [Aidingimonas halophila]SDY11951.1 hypothetical protein SAMN05443545_11160 [Aidingimonas halophila]
MSPAKRKERLVALIGLAILLFSPPLILIFDRYAPSGITSLSFYLFVAWGLVIALTAWLMEYPSHDEQHGDDGP